MLNSFVLILIPAHAGLNLLLLVTFAQAGIFLHPIVFVLLSFVTIPLSFEVAELFLHFFYPRADLPRLQQLTSHPKVALLYLTCDDFDPEAIENLSNQDYPKYDIFILDDSEKSIPPRPSGQNVTIIRRESRKGFKAGNLNYWLQRFSCGYDYFVILDSDSILSTSFLSEILRYAEHPANLNVAIFQAEIHPRNPRTYFEYILSVLKPYRMYLVGITANLSHSLLSWGHNNLHRTRILREIGGFDETYIAEDAATSLHLIKAGYVCKLVNVRSYDTEPSNIMAFTRRALRWARQTIQLTSASWEYVPCTVRLQFFRQLSEYTVSLIYTASLVAVPIFTVLSTGPVPVTSDVTMFSYYPTALKAGCVAGFFMPVIVFLMRLPIIILGHVRIRAYVLYSIVTPFLFVYITIPQAVSILRYLITGHLQFDVTPKGLNYGSFWSGATILNVVVFVLFIGSSLGRGFPKLTNWVWLALWGAAPFILYWLSKLRRG